MVRIGNKAIPEVLNDYNVYDMDGEKKIGVTDSITLASIQLMTAAINGAGVMGEYNTPVVGHVQSVQQEIPFRVLYGGVTRFLDHTRTTGVTIRGPIQVQETDTGITKPLQLRFVVRGKTTEVNPGTAKAGDAMGASVKFEALYILLEVGGETLIEMDKLNGIFVVNGVDLMEEYRRMC